LHLYLPIYNIIHLPSNWSFFRHWFWLFRCCIFIICVYFHGYDSGLCLFVYLPTCLSLSTAWNRWVFNTSLIFVTNRFSSFGRRFDEELRLINMIKSSHFVIEILRIIIKLKYISITNHRYDIMNNPNIGLEHQPKINLTQNWVGNFVSNFAD
jgi:hypothetical protein